METEWYCKHFNNLTNEELYEIFHLRLEVFVVEQNCPYQDADDKDMNAWHLLGYSITPTLHPIKKTLVAYSRILPAGVSYTEPSIGRVITSRTIRRKGAGKQLMKKSMEFIKKEFGEVPVRIGAQAYLQKFYEGFGFIQNGDSYLEDNIPHILMLYTPCVSHR